MASEKYTPLSRRIEVEALVDSRYQSGERPDNWDDRTAGSDVIKTTTGQTIKLWSDGGQSPPKPGWVILLQDQVNADSYRWTLYGLPPGKTAGRM